MVVATQQAQQVNAIDNLMSHDTTMDSSSAAATETLPESADSAAAAAAKDPSVRTTSSQHVQVEGEARQQGRHDGVPTRADAVQFPSVSASAVLVESTALPPDTPRCRGHDFAAQPNSVDALVRSFLTTGFQATNLAQAVEQIRQMREWRLSDTEYIPGSNEDPSLEDPAVRKRIRARLFLAYTSNQISCGQREVIRFLVQHKMVDVLITTAGGVEEDLIKCLEPTYMGDFALSGRDLRRRGINRIGNLLVPNHNYCRFEDWLTPQLHRMHDEQDEALRQWTASGSDEGGCGEPLFPWTPSKLIERLGREINHPDSVLFWAAKNSIPVFCPALTDGSLGDMLYFHSYKRPGFVLDICRDIRRLNDLAVRSHATGQIILGGGLVKHHCCNANLMRNGADFSVYVNTASDYDGSDSGASPDEAVSWGKIRITAQPVKVTAEASIAFPLIVSQTFAKDVDLWMTRVADTVCWADDLDQSD